MRGEPDWKGAATVPEPGVLQARLLADFRRSVHRVRVGKGSGDVSETCGAGESSSREQPPSALARRSASAEASKCALSSGCAEARTMIDALLTSGEVDNPCSSGRLKVRYFSVVQAHGLSCKGRPRFDKSPRIAPGATARCHRDSEGWRLRRDSRTLVKTRTTFAWKAMGLDHAEVPNRLRRPLESMDCRPLHK